MQDLKTRYDAMMKEIDTYLALISNLKPTFSYTGTGIHRGKRIIIECVQNTENKDLITALKEAVGKIDKKAKQSLMIPRGNAKTSTKIIAMLVFGGMMYVEDKLKELIREEEK